MGFDQCTASRRAVGGFFSRLGPSDGVYIWFVFYTQRTSIKVSCKAEVDTELCGNVVSDCLLSSCSGLSCGASLKSVLRPDMLPPLRSRSQSGSRMPSIDGT